MKNLLIKIKLILILIIISLGGNNFKIFAFEEQYEFEVLDSSSIYTYNSISCFDNLNCVVLKLRSSMGAIIEKTIDGFLSSNIIYKDTAQKDDNGNVTHLPGYTTRKLFYFKSGLIIGICLYGEILKSTDFGNTWNLLRHELDKFYFGKAVMVNENVGFAISIVPIGPHDRNIYYTDDGFETWQILEQPEDIKDKYVPQNLTVQHDGSVAVGFFKNIATYETVHYKIDITGKNWELMSTPQFSEGLIFDDVYFKNSSEAVCRAAALDEKRFRDTVLLYKTYDGGANWQLKFKTTRPYNLSTKMVHNDNTVYILGRYNLIVKSTDFGDTWYFINDSLHLYGYTRTLTDASLPSPEVLYYTTIEWGRIVKYHRTTTSVFEPPISKMNIFPNPVVSGGVFFADYEVESSGNIKIYIADISGKEISTLYNNYTYIGNYRSNLYLPSTLSSGSYWLIFELNGVSAVKMLNVLK